MKKIVFLLIIEVTVIFQSFSQLSVIENYGAKSYGIASINSIHQDINAIYNNPAGLAYIDDIEMIFGFTYPYETFDLSCADFGIAKNFKKAGVFGLGIKKFGFNEYNEFQFGLDYSRKLSKSFTIGTRFNLYNLSITGYGKKNAMNADVGIQYYINDNLLFGVNMINPFPVNFIGDTDLPTIIQAGIAFKLSDKLKLYSEIEKHINFNYLVKIGIEYQPIDAFTLYAGYRNDLEQFSDYSFGFRYTLTDNFYLTASTLYDLTLGLSPAMSVVYMRR